MEKSNLKIYFIYFTIGVLAVGSSFLTAQYFLNTLSAQTPPAKTDAAPTNALIPPSQFNQITPEMQQQILKMQQQMQQQGGMPPQMQQQMPQQNLGTTAPPSTLPSVNNIQNIPTKKVEMNNPNMDMIKAPAPNKQKLGGPDAGKLVQSSEFDLILEPYNYDPNGRRDPFLRVELSTGSGPSFPLLPLERFDLSQIKLTGIIWDVNNPKAMFMDPNDKVHILSKNQRIGRNKGYIAVIREGEVVVVEAGLEGAEEAYTTKVLRIIGNQ